jgi:hypothetical protein
MKKVFEVEYQITDKGFKYPVKTKEVEAVNASFLQMIITKDHRDYAHAEGLSRQFQVEVLSSKVTGYAF